MKLLATYYYWQAAPGLGFGVEQDFSGGPGFVEEGGIPVGFEGGFGFPLAEGEEDMGCCGIFPEFEMEAAGEIPDEGLLLLEELTEDRYLFGCKFHFYYPVDHWNMILTV
jgi:hypothetical protein